MLVPVRRVRSPAAAGLGLDLGQPRRRAVDLEHLAPACSSTSSDGGPAATALPWDMISTVSASRCASSM